MKHNVTKKSVLLFIVFVAALLSLSLVGVFRYNYIAYPLPYKFYLREYPAPDPEGDWLDIRHSRLKLEESHLNGSIAEGDYKEEKAKLIATEDEILRRFVAIKAEYEEAQKKEEEEREHYRERYRNAGRPHEFWVSIIALCITGISTISAIFLAWRNDRRVAKETLLKMTQLKQQLEDQNLPKIIIP